jgi:hypothetical protein
MLHVRPDEGAYVHLRDAGGARDFEEGERVAAD